MMTSVRRDHTMTCIKTSNKNKSKALTYFIPLIVNRNKANQTCITNIITAPDRANDTKASGNLL